MEFVPSILTQLPVATPTAPSRSNALQLIHMPLHHPALDELLHHLRAIYQNGGAEFARFQVVDCSLHEWFTTRTRQDELPFILNVLNNPTVISAFPVLRAQAPLKADPRIEPSSALTLDGELAQVLVQGGAYTQFSGTGSEAKAIGQRFCQALFSDRYTDMQIYKSSTAWSEWFGDVMWDCTWFGLDLHENQVWILSVTDTD